MVGHFQKKSWSHIAQNFLKHILSQYKFLVPIFATVAPLEHSEIKILVRRPVQKISEAKNQIQIK